MKSRLINRIIDGKGAIESACIIVPNSLHDEHLGRPSFHSVEAPAPLRTYQSIDASYSALCIGI
jgi:hypothetical protein